MSVDAQITALTSFCEASGYSVYKIYNDAGISARKSYKHRPALLEMLEDCQHGNIDIVLFTRLDRFFRSVPDYYACVEQMNGVPWRAISEDYETTTPDGVFKVNIMLSVAQSEADKTSLRVKDNYRYRKLKGEWYGIAPIGYMVKDKKLIKDPEKEKAMSDIFQTYLSTLSTAEAFKKTKDHGLNIDWSNFHKILKNPVYAGTGRNGHYCPAYITQADHEKICQVRASRSVSKKYYGRIYLFSGIVFCGYCGRRLQAKGRIQDGKEYLRYVCQSRKHKAMQIAEIKLESYLLECVDQVIDTQNKERQIQRKGTAANAAKKKKLTDKMERTKDLYIDGDISKEEYQKRKTDIERQISLIPEPSGPVPVLPKTWKGIYMDLSKPGRCRFWKSVIRSITITNETKGNPDIIFKVAR